ncbi:MAG TPA: hypothetical protein VJR92_14720, partial [Gemmatimonadaceae bacterium]|nr:hypothetical protein [Gemmatimonadaceae bacterium]
QSDVRRIALSLAGVTEERGRFAYTVENKGKAKKFAWSWNERVDPKKPRVRNPRVLAVRVANLGEKDLVLSHDPEKFFTEPHYNGFPAVLVHLPKITVAELRPLLREAWRCLAPKEPRVAASGKRRVRMKKKSAARAEASR